MYRRARGLGALLWTAAADADLRSRGSARERLLLAGLVVLASIPSAGGGLRAVSFVALPAAIVQLVRIAAAAGLRHSMTAVLAAALPSLPVIAMFHELTNGSSSNGLRLALLVTWSGFALVLGLPATSRLSAGSGSLLLGGLASTTFFALPLALLLGPDASAARRLQLWMGEIDNAIFVAVARGVLTEGPQAGGVGVGRSGFAIAPDALLSLVGQPWSNGIDVRLAAVDLVLLAAVSVIVVIGLSSAFSLALVTARLGDGSARSREGWSMHLVGAPAQFIVGMLATGIGLIVAAVAPLRTGFLTFSWGFAWVLLAFVAVMMARSNPSRMGWSASALAASAAAWMALATHPTAAPAALLLAGFALVQLVVRRSRDGPPVLGRSLRLPMLSVSVVGGTALVALILAGGRTGLPELTGDSLAAGGSGIAVDGPLRTVLGILVIGWGIPLAWQALRRRTIDAATGVDFTATSLAALPILGFASVLVVLSWMGLAVEGASEGYFVRKAAYAVAAAVVLFAIPSVLGSSGARASLRASVFVSLALIFGASSVTDGARSWWFWATLPDQPHAQTVIAAIDATASDAAIRCRPDPELVADSLVRAAAYACVAWPETAFNTVRSSQDIRADFLRVPDGMLLDEVVGRLDESGWYFVSYTFQMETGWFGWTRIP